MRYVRVITFVRTNSNVNRLYIEMLEMSRSKFILINTNFIKMNLDLDISIIIMHNLITLEFVLTIVQYYIASF